MGQAHGSAFIDVFFCETWGHVRTGQRGSEIGFSLYPKFAIPGAGTNGGSGEADLAIGYFSKAPEDEAAYQARTALASLPPLDGAPDGLDPAFRQQIFDVVEAQREPNIEPDRVLDDFGRKAIAAIADFDHRGWYGYRSVTASLPPT